MPSPIKPSDIAEAVVGPLSKVCTRFDQLLKLPSLLLTFWNWAFDSVGNATDEFKELFAFIGVPVGGLIEWPTATLPAGFLLCDGQAVSRTTYAKLYSVLGTVYGAGDGSLTFNLPDYRAIFLVGEGGSYSVGTNQYGEVSHVLLPSEGAVQGHTHATGYAYPGQDDVSLIFGADVSITPTNTQAINGDVQMEQHTVISTANTFTSEAIGAQVTPIAFPLVPRCMAVKRLIKY